MELPCTQVNRGFVQVDLDQVMRVKIQGVSIAANPANSEDVPNIFKKKKKNFILYNKYFYIQVKKF